MVTHRHEAAWFTPSPLWRRALKQSDPSFMSAPLILRFATDSFMEELIGCLKARPENLYRFVVRQETWKDERAGLPGNSDAWPVDQKIRLYQPAHGRFYLVTASLNCKLPGLPNKEVDDGAEERVSFVLRRVGADGQEQGWVPSGKSGSWQSAPAAELLAGEERHPLFALAYQEDGRPRRLWAGMIPVASQETYEKAGGRAETGDVPDPRKETYAQRVHEPWKDLFAKAAAARAAGDPAWTEAREREISTFLLLDLADFLKEWLQQVWALLGQQDASGLAGEMQRQTAAEGITLAQALLAVDAAEQREAILAGTAAPYNLRAIDPGPVRDLVRAEIDKTSPASRSSTVDQEAPVLSKLEADDETVYRIRCVYERPHCQDLYPDVLSAPSVPFRLAAFFEPEAPTRPVRIALPKDTSIAGLRKFQKNVAMVMSDKLKNQLDRLSGKSKEGRPGAEVEQSPPTADDPPVPAGPKGSIEWIDIYSLPIITLCALILLMIIVQILNMIFFWLPFFRIRIPVKRG